MKNSFVMQFPLDEKYFVSLRLATAGVCDVAGLDVEKTEDFKLCVAEACLSLMRAGYSVARVAICGDDGMRARVEGVGESDTAPKLSDEGENFTLSLLQELVDDVQMERVDGKIRYIEMKAKA